MKPIDIDPRAFHAFSHGEEYLLFDRATGGTFEIDEATHELLAGIERGLPFEEAVEYAGFDRAGAEAEQWRLVLRQLKDRGALTFTPVDRQKQEDLLPLLWNHQPRRLQLLMAQGCNLGCRYCYAWRNGSNQKGTLMTWEVAKAAVDYLVRRSAERPDLLITFFGGEPLLNYEMVRRVVQYGRELESSSDKTFSFELITNGTLLTPEITDWLVEERFLLFISLDGWREMHNHNRPAMDGTDKYDIILANAVYANERFISAGLVPPKVRANLTAKFDDGQAVGEYLASLGFKIIGVGPIEPLPHGDPSPNALTEDQMDLLHERSTAQVASMIRRVASQESLTYFEKLQLGKLVEQSQTVSIKGIMCGIGRNTQTIDNKGNIFPCHRYEGMEAYILGNVFEGLDFERTMGYYRKVNRNATNRCHSCWIRDYCGGGCAWLLSAKDGHLADPTERECNRRRKSFEVGLWARKQMRELQPEFFRANGSLDLDQWNWGDGESGHEGNETGSGGVAGSSCEEGCGNCASGCGN